jgi:hypothetical protein
MFRFKTYIAIFLLLLFVRVLIPETAALAMHTHEHTQDEHGKTEAGFKLDKKHNHCHTDHFYNVPFVPAFTAVPEVISLTFTDTYSADHAFIWKFTFPNNTDLRGPPQT